MKNQIPLDSHCFSGYSEKIRGEDLTYHSPIPTVTDSLLVRSLRSEDSIAWKSAPIPYQERQDDEVVALVVMVGFDVTSGDRTPRKFAWSINGIQAFEITNPVSNEMRDFVWCENDASSPCLPNLRVVFRPSMIDKYGDLMGFVFLEFPTRLLSSLLLSSSSEEGEVDDRICLRFDVVGESAGERTWFMVFKDSVSPSISLWTAPAVVRCLPDEFGVAGIPKQMIAGLLFALFFQKGDEEKGGEGEEEDKKHIIGDDDKGKMRVFLQQDDEETEKETMMIAEIGDMSLIGSSRFEICLPAVEIPTKLSLRFEFVPSSLHASVSCEFVLQPVKKIEIHIIHHTHLDIGYTHLQDEVEKIQWGNLEKALEIEGDDGFVWHPEGNWAVESYLLQQHESTEGEGEEGKKKKKEALIEGIQKGWIELGSFFANHLCGLYSAEGLLRSLEVGKRLADLTGVQPKTELVSDIPGCPQGVVTALALSGIRYFSMGPNLCHRIGSILRELGDRPFWWVDASKKHRLLTWVHGAGYAWFHDNAFSDKQKGRSALNEERIFKYCDQLVEQGYPYEFVCLRYCIGADNGPPDATLVETVRAWNQKYVSPRIVLSSATQFFEVFEERHGAELETRSGDLTGYWEDGAASSAIETALVRRASENLIQTETLAALLRRLSPKEDLYQAWKRVNLFFEHTWGAWNSISDPKSDLAVQQWEKKRQFAEQASQFAIRIRKNLIAAADDEQGCFDVHNTSNWTRSGIVILPAGTATTTSTSSHRLSVFEEEEGGGGGDGHPVLTQVLSTGEVAFLAANIAGFGRRRFRVRATVEEEGGDGSSTPSPPPLKVSPTMLENGILRVEIDPGTGTITSLVSLESGRDFVDAESGDVGLNQFLYVSGRNPESATPVSQVDAINVKEKGPLIASVEITASVAPATNGPLCSEIRLFRGFDHIEIINTIDKKLEYEPEAVLYRFPFDLSSEEDEEAGHSVEIRVDNPFGSYSVEKEQIPGSSKNYLNMQRWVDLHHDTEKTGCVGVTFVSIDVPMFQLGEIRTDPVRVGWVDHLEPTGVLYSYVMNNYWETNYCAGQEGEFVFRYLIRPHGQFVESEVERFAVEFGQPLAAIAVLPSEDDSVVGLPFRVGAERSVVTLVRQLGENSFGFRVYNPGKTDDNVLIVSQEEGVRFQLFDGSARFEKNAQPVTGLWLSGGIQISLVGYEVVSLVIEIDE